MTLTIGDTRVRVHPLALMVPALAARLGEGAQVGTLLFSLAAHEAAHLFMARQLGVPVAEVKLAPFGGTIQLGNPYALSSRRLLAIAAAGPLANLLLVVASAALCQWGWLGPEPALNALRVNLCLMVFNLLPALPLDGGRMLYAALAPALGQSQSLRIGICLGYVTATALLGLTAFLWLRTGQVNLSPLLAAVFLVASGPEERRALGDTRAQALVNALRPLTGPTAARLWAVDESCTVREALRVVRPDAETLYAVYDRDGGVALTDARRLLRAALDRDDIAMGALMKSRGQAWRANTALFLHFALFWTLSSGNFGHFKL